MAFNILKTSKNVLNHLNFYLLNRFISTKQLTVTPYCNINVKSNFNLHIEPLDVFKYHNCDKVIIEFDSENDIICCQSNDDIDIITNENATRNTNCKIIAPVKANFKITSAQDVKLSNFNSDKIIIQADGDVDIQKCQAELIDIQTNGNITSNSVLQAAKIFLKTSSGHIKTGRLQGLKLTVQTTNGNINTESTYCDESLFETEYGDLNLENIHKHIHINIKEGNLNIVGLDGSLNATIEKGDSDIQIARILSNSSLCVKKSGNVILKLANSCEESTSFEVASNKCFLAENLNMNLNKLGTKFHVTSKQNIENTNNFILECTNSVVQFESASWSEMMKLKFGK